MTPFIIWMVKALPLPHNTGVSFESGSVCSQNNNEISQALMFSHKARGSVVPLCWRHANTEVPHEHLFLSQSMCPVYTARSYTVGVILNQLMGTRGLPVLMKLIYNHIPFHLLTPETEERLWRDGLSTSQQLFSTNISIPILMNGLFSSMTIIFMF